MSAKTPRVFARDFKIDLCRQIQSGQKRPAQVCREHQLTEGVLLRWRREFEARGEDAFLAKETAPGETLEQKLEQKIAELERFCGQLSLDNAILKKAVSQSRSRSATP
jgi:transposase